MRDVLKGSAHITPNLQPTNPADKRVLFCLQIRPAPTPAVITRGVTSLSPVGKKIGLGLLKRDQVRALPPIIANGHSQALENKRVLSPSTAQALL